MFDLLADVAVYVSYSAGDGAKLAVAIVALAGVAQHVKAVVLADNTLVVEHVKFVEVDEVSCVAKDVVVVGPAEVVVVHEPNVIVDGLEGADGEDVEGVANTLWPCLIASGEVPFVVVVLEEGR